MTLGYDEDELEVTVRSGNIVRGQLVVVDRGLRGEAYNRFVLEEVRDAAARALTMVQTDMELLQELMARVEP